MFKRAGVWYLRMKHEGRLIKKSLGTGNKKLALKIEHKIKLDIAEGRYFDKPVGEKKTFDELIEKFMEEHGPTVSENMQKSYGYSKKHLSPFFGPFFLQEISNKKLSGYKAKRRKQKVRPATINRELAMFSKAFNLAVDEWEWLGKKPFKKIPWEKEDNERDRWLTLEEENELLSCCPNWLWDIVVFDLNTGLREDELLSMAWSWVQLFRKTLIIPGKFAKNKKPRTIPLNKLAMEILVKKAKTRNISNKLVFSSQAETKIGKDNLLRTLKTALEKAEIRILHSMTFGTLLPQDWLKQAWIFTKYLNC